MEAVLDDPAQGNDEAAALLARMAQGSQTALRAFYDSHHKRIYAFALKRLREPAEAAEVLNEVMLHVWRRAGTFEGRSKVSTWVLGIANHKVLDCLRRRGTRTLEELDDNLLDANADCTKALSAAQDAILVKRCMENLSDVHRQVMHLAFFEDLPYPEIAQIVDAPVGTIKTRVFHAKRLLQECLENAGLT
jgi:RNA polymerase sigma-70 factor (ECF subfamily)